MIVNLEIVTNEVVLFIVIKWGPKRLSILIVWLLIVMLSCRENVSKLIYVKLIRLRLL